MKSKHIKIIRTATISLSLEILLRGQLKYLNQFYHIVAVSGHDKHLDNIRDNEGVSIISVPFKRTISLVNDLVSFIKLYLLFLREKPQIVHSITPKAGLITMLAARFAFVPIRIHSFTGLIFPTRTGLTKHILIFCDKIICWAATNIYPEGEGVKNDLINYRITDKEIKVIANGNINGIDCQYFSPLRVNEADKSAIKKKLGICKGDFIFLFAGRLVTDKGINELVLAFQKLEYENIKLVLLGDYEIDLDPLSQQTLEVIKSNKRIITPGFVNDVRLYFSISDVFVLPSYREGFPNVLLQAGAMDLPCIVTDINGSNEIIKNDFNGIIIPTHDVNALSDSMLALFQNKIYRSILSSNSRQHIFLNYNQEIVWQAIKNEYDTLIRNLNN